VGAALVDVGAGVLEVALELVGGGDGGGRGGPGLADVAVDVDALRVALAGELGDLGEDADAAAGEAEEAVDLEVVFVRVRGGVVRPVVAAEEGSVVFAAAEAAEHVQVREPAAEEVRHFVLPVHGLGAAAGDDHASRCVEVVLPGDGHFEGVGGDDFERGEHDCGR